LERLGEEAAPALRKALASKPAPEVRRRIESILKKSRTLSPETLLVVRAVEVLENIGTPEARELLKSLADGVPEAVLTQEAKASLERLAEKSR
jgi:HEAT repeat protein